MKIAAIDIGSNAARMQISSVLKDGKKITFKKVEYVRFALRLGMDVFNNGRISYESEARIKKLLTVYKLLMELHEVDAYMICATSAMREAENGINIVERIKLELGMQVTDNRARRANGSSDPIASDRSVVDRPRRGRQVDIAVVGKLRQAIAEGAERAQG